MNPDSEKRITGFLSSEFSKWSKEGVFTILNLICEEKDSINKMVIECDVFVFEILYKYGQLSIE
jgi:hypothetical protein